MPAENLTRREAQDRAAQVTVRSYDISLNLVGSDEVFDSTTRIDFGAAQGSETFVDLIAESISSITLNGEEIPLDVYHDSRIHLADLAEDNQLVVVAKCNYMHTGEGMHRFVDPVDSQAYVYTQFEVPDARRVYACFEQPDMKATFTFHVRTPKHWTVFSNSTTPSPVEDGPEAHRFDFEPSDKISTYITALVAGPYVGQTGALTSRDGREIPLGVFCRASLLEFLDAEEIMDITKAGFKFYEENFDSPYPFTKYDQIFVPEYNMGAMENAGCVTFRDAYVFRSRPTQAMVERRCVTILHELAHMWFGDLVTMRWWNDLWLNESFAEYMSTLATAEVTRFTDAWTTFNASEKNWAYRQDQLPSTHPIVAEIRDLADVEVNFDGITYAKGASVLTQLVSYVGRENFFAGIASYFKKHAWGNTELSDFLLELEATSGRDLKTWSKLWLEESGVNLLRPRLEVNEEGTLTKFEILQELGNASSLRPHRIAVAGYDEEDGKLVQVWREELDVAGAITEVPIKDVKRPSIILLNDGDLAYAKVRLDAESLANVTKLIAVMPDEMSRSLIISGAWDMLRDGELAAHKFINLILSAIPVIEHSSVLASVLRQLVTSLDLYATPNQRVEIRAEVAERLLRMARTAAAGSDSQLQLVRAAAVHAVSAEQIEAIRRLYIGADTLMGLVIDDDLAWHLLRCLVVAGVAGEVEIAEREQADPTLGGAQQAAGARASFPDKELKAAVWNTVVHDASLANDTRIAMMLGYWAGVSLHPELAVEKVSSFFETARKVWDDHTFATAEEIITTMFPTPLTGLMGEETDITDLGAKWLEEHQDEAPSGLLRLMREALSDAQRAKVCQAVGNQS